MSYSDNISSLLFIYSVSAHLWARIFYSFRHVFELKAVYVIFVVNEVAQEEVFLLVLRFSLVDFSHQPPILYVLAVVSVFKLTKYLSLSYFNFN
jgi:hypothetical protein